MDLKNSLDSAKEEGKIEVPINLLKNNVFIDIIINSTGLTKDPIEKLK